MFDNLKDEITITADWHIWCDEKGKLWMKDLPFTILKKRPVQKKTIEGKTIEGKTIEGKTVEGKAIGEKTIGEKPLERREYHPKEKSALIIGAKTRYFENARTVMEEDGAFPGSIDTERLEQQWEYEYNTRKKYLPEILPAWITADEDMDLLAANVCTESFAENIKRYSGQQAGLNISYYDFFPLEQTDRETYLKDHPYIKESMECFMSTEWGCYDYPGGEILQIEKDSDHYKIICSRRDDWDYTIKYVSITFLNCILMKEEYDHDIIIYKDSEGYHSNISLCAGRVCAGQEERVRFHFLIEDEYGTYYDLILECEDVAINYSDKHVLKCCK